MSARERTSTVVTTMATATHDTAMRKVSRKPPARALTADSPWARSDEVRPLEATPSTATAMAADTCCVTLTSPEPIPASLR